MSAGNAPHPPSGLRSAGQSAGGTRHVAIAALALVSGVALSAVHVPGLTGQSGTHVPTPTAIGAPAPAEAVIGVNVDLMQYDAPSLAKVVERLASAGIGYVRQPVPWAAIEPEAGRYAWDRLDTVVDALDRRGVRMLATLQTSPAWARQDPTPEPHIFMCQDAIAADPTRADAAPPTDPADLAAFAVRLAERYRGRVWAGEGWNEPNLLPNWRRTGPDPA